MIVGDTEIFAIESGITHSYERLSFRALGFFAIHVGGHRFGVYRPDATLLACSFDEVNQRIADRGRHTAAFAANYDAGQIADAFLKVIYSDEADSDGGDKSVLGTPLTAFRKLFHTKSDDRVWAPDGDEAFDDGSHVLQFDVEDRVRLIAFKSDEGFKHDPATLRDVWIPSEDFYDILLRWRDAFESEWTAMPKISPE